MKKRLFWLIPLAAWFSSCQSGTGLTSGQKVQDDVYAVADGSANEAPAIIASSGNATLDSYLGGQSRNSGQPSMAQSNRGLDGSRYDQYRDDFWLTPGWRPGLSNLDPDFMPLSGGSRWSFGMNCWSGLGMSMGFGPLGIGMGQPWMGSGLGPQGWGMSPFGWSMSPWGDPFWNGGINNPYWNNGWSNPMWSTGWGNPWSGSIFSPWSNWGHQTGFFPGGWNSHVDQVNRTSIPVNRESWGRGYLPTNSGFTRGGALPGRGQQPVGGRAPQVPAREIDNRAQPSGRNNDWVRDNQPAQPRNERGSFWREVFSGDDAPSSGRSRNTEAFPSRQQGGGWSQPAGGGFSSPRGGGGGGGATSRPR